MDLAQLKYFQAAARLQNITRAAESLHISQPALSRAINKLEGEVGSQLFDRDSNRIRLNSHGTVFLRRVNQILLELDAAQEELRQMSGIEYGSVTLSSFTQGLLNTPICDFLTKYPNVHFTHKIQSPDQMQRALERGECDIALSIVPIVAPDIIWIPVMEDQLLVLISSQHELSRKKELHLQELANEHICMSCYENGMKEILEGFCLQAGFEPQILYEGSDSELIMSFLHANACVFLIPASIHMWKILIDRRAFSTPEHPPFSALPITWPACQWQYGIAISKVRTMSDAVKAFYRTLMSYFTEYRKRWNSSALMKFLEKENG